MQLEKYEFCSDVKYKNSELIEKVYTGVGRSARPAAAEYNNSKLTENLHMGVGRSEIPAAAEYKNSKLTEKLYTGGGARRDRSLPGTKNRY